MLRPPPISTLFPYTTLFRSERRRNAVRGAGPARVAERREPDLQLGPRGDQHRSLALHRLRAGHLPAVRLAVARGELQLRDRKSTRLNSSHTVISYAVFCLKK